MLLFFLWFFSVALSLTDFEPLWILLFFAYYKQAIFPSKLTFYLSAKTYQSILDNAIKGINCYTTDKRLQTYWGNLRIQIYQLDSVIQPSNDWGLDARKCLTHNPLHHSRVKKIHRLFFSSLSDPGFWTFHTFTGLTCFGSLRVD